MQTLDLCYPSALRRGSIIPAIKSLAAQPVKESLRISIFTDNPAEPATSISVAIKELQQELSSVRVFDLKARQNTIEELSALFDRELLNYALLPPADGTGWGVNVNAAMLYSSGNIFVTTDDDIISEPKSLAKAFLAETGLSDTQDDSKILLYFESQKELLSALHKTDINVLQYYLDIFAKNDATAEPVLWINPGLYGDTGMGSARAALSLTGPSRAFLMQNYNVRKYSRMAVQIHNRTVVSAKPNLMAGQTAFYNKLPLVPFMPFGRNIDGLSGMLTRFIYPESKSAYTDFCLPHNIAVNTSNTKESLLDLKPGIADLAMALAVVNKGNSRDPFYYYGELFSSVGSLSNSGFVDQLHGSFSLQFNAVIAYYEKMLEEYQRTPSDWAADLEAHIEKIRDKMRNPMSVFGKEGCGLSLERAKFHLYHYGELLKIWPELWQKGKAAF